VGDIQRLIAFDLDGTLIESRRDLADSANELIVEHGGTPLSIEEITGMVGEGARVLVARALAAAGVGDVPDALQRFLEIYDTRLLNHTRFYDGITEVVEAARRHARVAILTNKPIAPTEKILSGLGHRDLFADVIGGDSPHGRKPDPAALQALMAGAGATPQTTLMVGDSRIDLETAHRAAVRCCIVTFGFGFRRESADGADWVADDVAALGRVIDEFTAGA
jgi:phosphoglycolate phosphatase